MNKALAGAALALLMAAPAAVQAEVSVGGYTFANNAFADQLVGSSGTFNTLGGSLATVLTDTDPGTYAFSFTDGAFVDLAFTDNVASNGSGVDIVLFELGNLQDSWTVTINGITATYGTTPTGQSAAGFSLNAAAFNLDDFGIGAGNSITNLRLGFVPGNSVASTSLVGALYPTSVGAVPEPGTWAMMLLGFGAMGWSMRRRRATLRASIA